MRLDKFLKVSRLIKRRTVANEACDAGRVVVNDKPAKASLNVKEGDIIEIDIPNSRINAQVSDEEFDARRKDHVAPPSKATSGWLARYQRNVSASCKGAVME